VTERFRKTLFRRIRRVWFAAYDQAKHAIFSA